MVKRQTVWLSTMMVLSLMLIGYYTMSNQSATTSGEAGATGPTVSTTTTEPGALQNQGQDKGQSGTSKGASQNNTSGTSGQAGKSQASSTTTASTSTSSSDDWFVSQETQLDQQMSVQISNLQQVIANNNASTDTISKAEQSLQSLENLKGNLAEAKDAIIGDGFKECVIVPTAANAQMHVYIKSDKLAASDVVKIMNIVSQQLEIPMTSVIVTSHA